MVGAALFVLFIAVSVALASVPSLDPQSFDRMLQSEPYSVILFYAPWCSVSSQFLPIFEKLDAASIAVGKVDCVSQESLYEKHNITSFPTMKAFIYGHPLHYEGSFDEEGLHAFIRRIQSSASHTLRADGGYDAFVEKHLHPSRPIAVCSSKDVPTLMNFDLACIQANSATCATSENPQLKVADAPFPSIFIRRHFPNEESVIIASEDIYSDHDQIKTFLMKNSYPQVLNFSKENEDLIFSTNRPGYSTHILIVGDSTLPKVNDMIESFKRLYESFWNRCVFVLIDCSAESEYLTNILNDIKVPRGSTAVLAVKTLVTKVNFYSFALELANDFQHDVQAWMEMVIDDSAPVFRTVRKA